MKSKPLSAEEILQRVEEFTEGITSFAVRENRIDYAEKLAVSNRRQTEEENRSQAESDRGEQSARLGEWESEAREQLEEIFVRRGKWIEKARLNVRRSVLEGIQNAEEERRYSLQMAMIESAKRRDQKVAEAQAEVQVRKDQFREVEADLDSICDEVRKRFRGFPTIRKKLEAAMEGTPGDEVKSVALEEAHQRLSKIWSKTRKNPMLTLYAVVPLWLQVLLALVIGGVALIMLPSLATSIGEINAMSLVWGTLGLVLLILLIYGTALSAIAGAAKSLGRGLVQAGTARSLIHGQLDEWLREQREVFESEHRQVEEAFHSGLKSTGAAAGSKRLEAPEQVDQKEKRIRERLESWKSKRLASIAETVQSRSAEIDRQFAETLAGGDEKAAVSGDFAAQKSSLISEWGEESGHLAESMQGLESSLQWERYWINASPDNWEVPASFPEEVAFAKLEYRLEESGARLPDGDAMPFVHAGDFVLPLRLVFPASGSILFDTGNAENREVAIASLNQIVGGLLTSSPPGRLSFSLVDPVGLGESFAGLMHLSDYEEHLVNKRVRTRPDQIEQRLGELCEHMEKVIQMYLRNEYETISEYNEAAGTTAERYHFLVVADFPRQFTDEAARRLLSIAQSGARCGVFTLIHYDRRTDLPSGFIMDDLRQSSVCLKSGGEGFVIGEEMIPGTELELLSPPDNEVFLRWMHRVGEANRDSNRIEVPFSQIAPGDEDFWSRESSHELRVPIGRTGATKFQELAIGKGTCQHALIAGKTGSGKSTIFHVMITNLALWFDPDQVEFYLIDFKKGVEFKAYATHRLPHARVIAIESDREFGLSVLQKLDEELKERGEKFRALGAQDIAGYQRAGGTDPMPRTLLLIDEFQEFFVEDDQISQQAAVLLDRIVRQGRAFGIHAILGSQTLGGAFTLARATLGQMVIRIALMCNEADAYLIMDDSNPAPRLLTRPGEGIYNDAAGSSEANSPFQVVWLDDGDRDRYLATVSDQAVQRGLDRKSLVIFEGNAPADVVDDRFITDLIRSGEWGSSPRFFLGAPNSIKSPTEAVFERRSGANLLIVGQRDDVVEGMILIGLRLLIEQMGDRGRFVLIDGQVADPNGRSWLKEAISWLGDSVECPGPHEMGEAIIGMSGELKARMDGESSGEDKTTFLVILGLQKYKKLRYEEDYSFSLEEDSETKPSDALNDLIVEGPGMGYHVIASMDTYNNVNRCISRKAVSEFEKKVLFQMSAADSASLIDSGRASDLGLNRSIFYNEATGVVETFRPYSQPSREWVKGIQ